MDNPITVMRDIVIDNYPFHDELNLKGLTILEYVKYDDSILLKFEECIDKDADYPHEVQVFKTMEEEYNLINSLLKQ
jgi:hypothetical protein